MKLAEVVPDATVTVGGVDSVAALLDKATVAAARAFRFKVTVQVLGAPKSRLAGVHCSEVIVVGACRLRLVDWEPPLRVAVTVAD